MIMIRNWFITTVFTLAVGIGTILTQSSGPERKSKHNGTKIEVNGVGHRQNLISNGGNAVISGSDNIITIKGSITTIQVSGASNTVYIDKINNISIEGSGNIVFYKSSGRKSGKALVSLTGIENYAQKN
ncbi:DUF3060 domain-containing protein [Chryseobacterium sp. KMC2]|uniref:DUF3060 domain-containing protein n=1 Tax=Chryseobacterium sp. KMC2 TaxID=2800705 RepID=UPI00192381D0|nr:DUF3060 domain-containing protein [Chryseobacterium sp. KMC2]MBL3547274.1 DUF3060 domain-containing protein [Chryseobacterium sp. KMC2]